MNSEIEGLTWEGIEHCMFNGQKYEMVIIDYPPFERSKELTLTLRDRGYESSITLNMNVIEDAADPFSYVWECYRQLALKMRVNADEHMAHIIEQPLRNLMALAER